MHIDRLRWLVQEGKHLTLEGAAEIAKAAPSILYEWEAVHSAWEVATRRRSGKVIER